MKAAKTVQTSRQAGEYLPSVGGVGNWDCPGLSLIVGTTYDHLCFKGKTTTVTKQKQKEKNPRDPRPQYECTVQFNECSAYGAKMAQMARGSPQVVWSHFLAMENIQRWMSEEAGLEKRTLPFAVIVWAQSPMCPEPAYPWAGGKVERAWTSHTAPKLWLKMTGVPCRPAILVGGRPW